MDYTGRLAISYYKTIAVLNEAHRVFLVQHRETGKICVRKDLSVYNRSVYSYLRSNPLPGIPRIYEIYEEAQTLTLIEEYVSGTTLAEMIASHALTLTSVFRIMDDLCAILSCLHAQDPPIIHRDIKPSNVIVDSYSHAVLIDFNAAKLEHRFADTKEDVDTVFLGTAGYAAPEQYGFGSSTGQTDIYALGILLREMVNSLPATDRLYEFQGIIDSCTQMEPQRRMAGAAVLRSRLFDLHTRLAERKRLPDESPYLTNHYAGSPSNRFRKFLPPGFRSRTGWKMLTAFFGYLLIFWTSLSLQVKDAAGLRELWIQRIGCLIWLLALVFVSLNYCDVQKLLPLCGHPNRIVRLIGILILDILVTFLVLGTMLLIIS